MEEVIAELKKLPVDSMNDEDLKQAVNKLKLDVLARNNSYISALIN